MLEKKIGGTDGTKHPPPCDADRQLEQVLDVLWVLIGVAYCEAFSRCRIIETVVC